MGTVLHLLMMLVQLRLRGFFIPLLDGDGVASWGQVWWSKAVAFGFSPLLDGDGVASKVVMDEDKVTYIGGFSPLLDGDGVASAARRDPARRIRFQSPSR